MSKKKVPSDEKKEEQIETKEKNSQSPDKKRNKRKRKEKEKKSQLPTPSPIEEKSKKALYPSSSYQGKGTIFFDETVIQSMIEFPLSDDPFLFEGSSK